MNNIQRVSLQDTLNLIQLVRETALSKGRQAQAESLQPVVEEMRELVEKNHQVSVPPAPVGGIMAQTDFRKLLDISQARSAMPVESSPAAAVNDRNRLVAAMAAADMPEVDIARQLGLTREEVRLVLNVQEKSRLGGGNIR